VKNSFVYVIATEDACGRLAGPVKVGITSNPDTRISTLKTACPNEIDIAYVLELPTREIARELERCFHSLQVEHRRAGEWFNLIPLRAAALLCLYLRFYLETSSSLTEEEKEKFLYWSGAWHIQRKILTERYISAWENQ
jgi:hypothetical protein